MEGAPEYERQEADEDMGLDPVLVVMPDRPDLQFILGNAKGPFRIRQLNVSFPQCGRIGGGQVRAQQIAAFRNRGPLTPTGLAFPTDLQLRFARRLLRLLDLDFKCA